MRRAAILALSSLLAAVVLWGQEPGSRVPSVTFAPVGKVQVKPGGTTRLELDFRVGEEFHINSNKPKSELLIPTKLDVPASEMFQPGAAVGVDSLQYPRGEDVSFPFAPGEKLSVYSGDFSITAVIRASPKAAPGNYPIGAELRFQACDRSACYPPRSIPVKFDVTVVAR
jgi:cytochrome c biogenesis DsbD-like protein